MEENHPKAAQIAGILEGSSQTPQSRALVEHLLRGCSDCATTAEQVVRPQRDLSANAYDAAFDKAFAAVQKHFATPPPPLRPRPRLALRRGAFSLPGAPI